MSALLLVAGVGAVAPEPTLGERVQAYFRPADECGDSKMISQAYDTLRGTVLEVTEGDMVIVKTRPLIPELPVFKAFARPNPIAVRLVSIDAPRGASPSAEAARVELRRLVLGRDVSILISPVQIADESLTGMLDVADRPGIDVGVQLLAKGLVKYRDFGQYAIDWWQECRYKLAETRAKTARLGIWAEP